MRLLASTLLATVLAGSAGSASAQPSSPSPGSVVRDARGETIGKVETVVTDSAGRPVQVIVRSGGVAGVRSALRALPVSSLRPARDGFVIPLRRSEFEVLPPVRR